MRCFAMLPALLLGLAVVSCCKPLLAAESRQLVVGIYQNPPKIAVSAAGMPSGIFGDLLVDIARQHNWQLKPVSCDWAYCLELLQSGDIDILPDVAYSPERALSLSFHQTPALYSWSRFYGLTNTNIQQLTDLDGLQVALLQDSVQHIYLQQLKQQQQMQMSPLLTICLATTGRLNFSYKPIHCALIRSNYFMPAPLIVIKMY